MLFRKLRNRREKCDDSTVHEGEPVVLPTSIVDAFTHRWSWKIDGPCLAVVLLALCIDRFLANAMPKEVLNLLALFALGLMLKRNLRKDVKLRHLKDALRERHSNQKGRIGQWVGKALGGKDGAGQ